MKNKCMYCGKMNEDVNYCDWDCHLQDAVSKGGTFITPNNLPVRCIRHDRMLEHEHADHKDYKFPVKIEYCGPTYAHDDGPWAEHERYEVHALIYSDGFTAVTMHEYCYAYWNLNTGLCEGGSIWKKGDWKLDAESRSKIKKEFKKHDT
jgi:hypothetical protein